MLQSLFQSVTTCKLFTMYQHVTWIKFLFYNKLNSCIVLDIHAIWFVIYSSFWFHPVKQICVNVYFCPNKQNFKNEMFHWNK